MIHLIENCRVYGLEDSVKASKYPMSVDTDSCTGEVTETVKKLAGCATGTGHDQFLTGIIAQFDLTFSIKAWVEAERYHFLDFVSSQSTMHRIASMDFDRRCNVFVTQAAIDNVKRLTDAYNAEPTPFNYLSLLYNVPVGFRLTARITTNYRQLKTIYRQRKDHRLPEWRAFCEWIEGLPHSEFITGKDDNNGKAEADHKDRESDSDR